MGLATGHAVSAAAGGMSVSVSSQGEAQQEPLYPYGWVEFLKGSTQRGANLWLQFVLREALIPKSVSSIFFVRCTGRYCVVNGP